MDEEMQHDYTCLSRMGYEYELCIVNERCCIKSFIREARMCKEGTNCSTVHQFGCQLQRDYLVALFHPGDAAGLDLQATPLRDAASIAVRPRNAPTNASLRLSKISLLYKTSQNRSA